MMYLSRGVLDKRRSKRGILIRYYGLPIELSGDEADIWERGRFGFAYSESPSEEVVVKEMLKKGLVVSAPGHSEIDKYTVLCLSGIYANRQFKLTIIPLCKPEKRILIWLKKAGINLNFSELVCLEDRGIEPKPDLLSRENSVKLMRIIYPGLVSIAGNLELRMLHSIVRKRTVDAVMKLLRRKRVIIM